MSKTIKAVFFDVDSTMYYHGIHDILPKTRAALSQLHEQGIRVGVATSRCRSELANMPAFFRDFPFDAIISDGGALIMEKDHILAAHYLKPALVAQVNAFARRYGRTFRYSTVDGNYFSAMPKQSDKDIFFQLYLNTPQIKPYEQDDVLNILLYAKEEQEIAELTQLLNGITFVSHGPVVEINAGSINKGEAISTLAKHWEISMDEIMSFGDGANDIEMIQMCGIGVAMGNGCDALKQAADFVSERIENEGIDHALRHFNVID